MAQQLELLAPAGTPEIFRAVIGAGADAVYVGGKQFGARAYAKNFDREELLRAIDFAHLYGRKVYLAVNTLLKEQEMGRLYDYLLPFYEQGLDAVIVQDFGVMQLIRRNFKDLAIHASTQMTVLGADGVRFLKEAGASRVVLGRELSFGEISKIHQTVPVELEVFVHGALCYCYSGQCLLSSMIGGRSGNRGRCAQPCRLPYEVKENGKRLSDRQHAYPLSPKDLCAVSLLPQLAENGVCSFKIEGRMKQAAYAAGVVSVYRNYLDRYLMSGEEGCAVRKEDRKKLLDLGSRSGFTEGYFRQKNGPDMITFGKPGHEKGGSETDAGEPFHTERKLAARGALSVKREEPAALTVEYQGHKVTVTGETAAPAAHKPVTEEALREKLNKTGNTPFAFEQLTVTVEEGLFLPAASVNALRRQALKSLEEQCLDRYRRKAEGEITAGSPKGLCRRVEDSGKVPGGGESFLITASAETKEQLSVLLDTPFVSRIYADSSIFSREDTVFGMQKAFQKAKDAKKQIYYILPAVFRSHTAVFYASILQKLSTDGFLVKGYDALGFLLCHGIKPERIRTDFSLYTWSRESKEAFLALGIAGDTVSPELNRRELMARENAGSEMLVYGFLPLMISAQCIRRNLSVCNHVSGIQELTDRYGVGFPVKNHCNECYNVIYNSRPLCLFSFLEEIGSFGIRSLRLSFTTESGAQVKKILSLLERVLAAGGRMEGLRELMPAEFTYGHYKRGVE